MITLWGRDNSTNVKKVRWALEELDIAYEQVQAGLQHGVNDTAAYQAMNPNALVPTLKDDATDSVLWESNTIVRYLAAQYGEGTLWIDEPAKRAQAEKWMDWANTRLSPAHRVMLMSYVRTPPEARDLQKLEEGTAACEELFALLDDALERQPWFSGDAFGLADIAVAPFIYNLWNCGLTWNPRTHLERWYQSLTERPAFQKVVMIPVS
ncbi:MULTISPECIES: glutathione S-transferase family protein [unclassified Halomonas]|uniref:glutathione S-transferase family protein n=1 Tax=unclassified Halomonas TaxID=2609666 RepID=UPI0021E39141|nr:MULTISPECIES: glutathione S-transferase family protein [unclassified Halomonas]UYG01499.1 glutathione S-transferase family protein [Halomonas sp. GD1P12]WNL37443.1 glutathione S-transferase family protein [Halomonas sp. PAMB 3232]WNL40760.1 glutathione S-transferase family protein [Halomonas sp. PAMB 3264]